MPPGDAWQVAAVGAVGALLGGAIIASDALVSDLRTRVILNGVLLLGLLLVLARLFSLRRRHRRYLPLVTGVLSIR